ncbi:MAG TPA: tetratricopeptide repeat protein [Pyrinomonadaceae bacterium]|nr:tetratricopeptide repeat protein [Pyrinomonadaceae bacterium]
MPLPVFRIFVSSTWEDLRPERQAIFSALHSHPQIKFVGMEDFGSRDEDTRKASIAGVTDSDLYVGIIGGRYGSGITEEEYREASRQERPRLIYFKDESTIQPTQRDHEPWPKSQRERFKEELRAAHTLCSEFVSPEDLAGKLYSDLSRWCAEETLRQVSKAYETSVPVHQLHSPIGNFVGRREEIKTLFEALTPGPFARVAVISGMGGAGKTELARRVAHDLCSSYPDSQLLIELGAHRSSPVSTVEALRKAIAALRVFDSTFSENEVQLTKEYRSLLSGKRALVMLDDALDAEQIRAFIPPAGCALLATSRKHMAPPGMTSVRVDELGEYDSSKLLRSFDARIEPHIANQISRLCAYLPLALCHAGSLLSLNDDLTPADYAERLRNERTRLEAFDSEDVGISVKATFNLTYHKGLTEEEQRVFRQLAVFPASFDEKAEAAVCADEEASHLKTLSSLCLVTHETKTKRYRLHDLVRLYADELVTSDERHMGARRHGQHYLGIAQETGKLHLRGDDATRRGLELFELEWANFRAGQAWFEANSITTEGVAHWCLDYMESLKYLLHLRRSPAEQVAWAQTAWQVSQSLGFHDLEGRYLSNLGTAYSGMGDFQKAESCFQRALELARAHNDKLSEGNVHGNLGNLLAKASEPGAAIDHYGECLRILYELNDGRGAGNTLNNLGNAYGSLGETQLAIEYYEVALGVAREINDRHSEGIALSNLGTEHANQGDAQLAITLFDEALAIMREIGDTPREVAVICSLANAYIDVGEIANAIQFHQQALLISQHINDRAGECLSMANLGHAYYKLGDNKLALEHHHQALLISRELGDRRHEGLVRWNIAQVLKDDEDLDEAISEGNRALAILDEIEYPKAPEVRETLDAWRKPSVVRQ